MIVGKPGRNKADSLFDSVRFAVLAIPLTSFIYTCVYS